MAEDHAYVLRRFIQKNNIKVMAEIGVYKSRTLRLLMKWDGAEQLKEYWAIDPWMPVDIRWGGWLSKRSQESWDKLYKKACRYMPWKHQLRVLRMTSEEASKLFILDHFRGHFDLVYIDASHFYEDVINDIKCWFPLVKKGGYLGGHDYGLNGEYSQEVADAVHSFFEKRELEIYPDRIWMKKT